MKNFIPPKLLTLAQQLHFPLYIVGGLCRDRIAGLECAHSDYDICSAADEETFAKTAEEVGFSVTAVYKRTGTVNVRAEGISYEFTRFRTDKYVRGVHTPTEVFFTEDIAADARRRDFKCNAVYYDILKGEYCDPLGGIADIKNKTLSTVAPADKVFGEDGLRLLRLCRLAAQTGFSPDGDCLNGARHNASLICDIAPERVWAELEALLCADGKYGICGGQYSGLCLLRNTGVLNFILPELALGDGMEQNPQFHRYDVLEHSFRCVLYAPRHLRLAALLHDVGKPYRMVNTGKFALHEADGERITGDICTRLRVPKKLAERTKELVRWHMYDFDGAARESKVRKFAALHGQIWDDLLLLKQADYSACADDKSEAPTVTKWKKIMARMREEGAPMSVKELSVRGDELISAGVPKEETSEVLRFLLVQCAIEPKLNEKSKLIKLALSR